MWRGGGDRGRRRRASGDRASRGGADRGCQRSPATLLCSNAPLGQRSCCGGAWPPAMRVCAAHGAGGPPTQRLLLATSAEGMALVTSVVMGTPAACPNQLRGPLPDSPPLPPTVEFPERPPCRLLCMDAGPGEACTLAVFPPEA